MHKATRRATVIKKSIDRRADENSTRKDKYTILQAAFPFLNYHIQNDHDITKDETTLTQFYSFSRCILRIISAQAGKNQCVKRE